MSIDAWWSQVPPELTGDYDIWRPLITAPGSDVHLLFIGFFRLNRYFPSIDRPRLIDSFICILLTTPPS